jgi:hypothetical protein
MADRAGPASQPAPEPDEDEIQQAKDTDAHDSLQLTLVITADHRPCRPLAPTGHAGQCHGGAAATAWAVAAQEMWLPRASIALFRHQAERRGRSGRTHAYPPFCSASPFVISPDDCVQIRPIWRLSGHDRTCMRVRSVIQPLRR